MPTHWLVMKCESVVAPAGIWTKTSVSFSPSPTSQRVVGDHRVKIGTDLTTLLPRHVGVDRFLLDGVRHVAQIQSECPGSQFTVLMNREDLALFRGTLPTSFVVRGVCVRQRMFLLFFQQVILPLATIFFRLDVVHSPAFSSALVSLTSPLSGRRDAIERPGARTCSELTGSSGPTVHVPETRDSSRGSAVRPSSRDGGSILP